MILEFSNITTALLKEHLTNQQLAWTTENTLDLTSIKKLKGCRNQLVEDCLRLIAQLDSFSSICEEKKAFSAASILCLMENLKTYIQSSDRYPRLKKFLNVIPDHTNGIVGFILIATSALSIVFPPFVVIPIVIFFWILLDLSFNNREFAKNLQEILYTVAGELRTVETADSILNKAQPAPTVQTSIVSQAGSSSTSKGYSARFYGSIERHSIHQDETQDNQSASRLTLN